MSTYQNTNLKSRPWRLAVCCLALVLASTGALLALNTNTARAAEPALPASPALDTSTPATVSDKDEVIYARLDAQGKILETNVINHFVVDKPGNLIDNGTYASVQNLTTTEALGTSGSEIIVPVTVGDFYYQGSLANAHLPWQVSITYLLDSKSISPEALAGSSGNLEIQIATKPDSSVPSQFFDNYVLQVQMTLDSAQVRNVVAPDATVAQAGNKQQVVFTVLPKKSAALKLKAQVENFEMAGIQISALPFSMAFDLPDTSAMTDDLSQLTDAIAQLDQGIQEFNTGVGSMSTGATALAAGSSQFNTGLSLLSQNSSLITGSSAKISGALQYISAQLAAGSFDPSLLPQLIGGLRQLSATLSNSDSANPGIAEALSGIKGGLDQVLGAPVPAAPSTVATDLPALGALLSDLSFQGTAQTNPTYEAALAAMMNITSTYPSYFVNSQTWMLTAQGAYFTGGGTPASPPIQATLAQLSTGCTTIASNLNLVATQLEAALSNLGALPALATGIATLANEYAQFDAGLAAYASGVDTLAGNYNSIDYALALLSNGIGSLGKGSIKLADGSKTLRINTNDMPQQMKDQIASFLDSYTGSSFKPISFVSPKNQDVKFVQFVMVTDAITIIKLPEPEPEPTPEPSFLDRVLALFGM